MKNDLGMIVPMCTDEADDGKKLNEVEEILTKPAFGGTVKSFNNSQVLSSLIVLARN